jgi:hypothetical protein
LGVIHPSPSIPLPVEGRGKPESARQFQSHSLLPPGLCFDYGGRAMKKLIVRIFLGLVIVLVLLVVGVFFFLGTIVKAGVEKVGPRVAKVPVKLDSASISVFSGSSTLKGFVLGNPPGYNTPEAIKVGTIDMAIAPGSLLAEKKHIRHIRVDGPEITYELDLKGSNLGKILDNVGGSAEQDKKAPTKKEQTSKTKLQVDEFIITGAKVRVGTTLLGSTNIALPEIRLTKLGEGPDGITPAELSKRVLEVVLNETTKAIAANPGKINEAVKALGTGTTDQIKKGASGLGDLLNKKK